MNDETGQEVVVVLVGVRDDLNGVGLVGDVRGDIPSVATGVVDAGYFLSVSIT